MSNSVSFYAVLGAAAIGAIGAVGLIMMERFQRKEINHAMAKDLARLNKELNNVKGELEELMAKKREKGRRLKYKKANSVVSTTTDDYMSASNMDSSDLEFYDVSDEENEVSGANISDILIELDKILDTGSRKDFEETLIKLQDLFLEHPENPDLLWRIGKAHYRLADTAEDTSYEEEQISKGIEACSLALKFNPDSSDVHKWYAILIGARINFLPMREKISNGHLFKKHVDAAIALDPNDGALHHLLGRFDYEAASLKWYERKVAGALFGEPPNSTYGEALEHFLKAEELVDYEWKENKLFIAKCKIAEGEHAEAVKWLDDAYKSSDKTEKDDAKLNLEIQSLLQKYNC